MVRVKGSTSKRSIPSSRSAGAGPWGRHEVLALLRAWGDVARQSVPTMKPTVGADDTLLFEKFQQAMSEEVGDDRESCTATKRTKDAVRTKMKRMELSFKCIQEYMKHQQPAPRIDRADLLNVAASTGGDWFALTKEQQLSALADYKPEHSRPRFSEIDKEAFELMERISQETKEELKQSAPDEEATRRDPRTKWSPVDMQHLICVWREALKLNPTVRPDPSSMFTRFNELSKGKSWTLTAFVRKVRLTMRAYKMFLAFDQVQSRDASAKKTREDDLRERIREFYEQRGRASHLPVMDDDVFVALGEIKYMMDSISSPSRQDRSSLPQEEHDDSDNNSSSPRGVKRYRIKKGVHDTIDLVERGICSSESEDDAHCWKKVRASQAGNQIKDFASSPAEDEGATDAEFSSPLQASMATTISLIDGDDSTSFSDTGGLEGTSRTGVRECGSSAECGPANEVNQGCASIAMFIDGSELPRVPPPIAEQCHRCLHPELLKVTKPCDEQTQCMSKLVEQVKAQRQLSQEEIWQVFSDIQEETRRDRDRILEAIRRVQDEQRRGRADTRQILEALAQIQTELRRLRHDF